MYCSRVCCSTAVKNALRLKELSPATQVCVLYRDMRTYGLNEQRYQEARDKGVALLTSVGLGDRVQHRPYELSGGQQQRVAIARALANDPAIILADEPTGNLDLRTGTEIIEILSRMNKEHEVTVITATHDHKMLAASDRVVWIRDGLVDRIERREDLKIEVGTIDGEAD